MNFVRPFSPLFSQYCTAIFIATSTATEPESEKNTYVFFSDSGSVAVEVALKIAVQYWLNKGQKGRTKFISFRHGYHGDTMAAMALCDPHEGMHAHFKGYLPEQILAEIPQDEAGFHKLDALIQQTK